MGKRWKDVGCLVGWLVGCLFVQNWYERDFL